MGLITILSWVCFCIVAGSGVGFTEDLGGQIVFKQTLALGRRRRTVDAPGDLMQLSGMTTDTVEILTVDPHMDV